jgi:hypothetical protein
MNAYVLGVFSRVALLNPSAPFRNFGFLGCAEPSPTNINFTSRALSDAAYK